MADILLSSGYKYNERTKRYEKIKENKEIYIDIYSKYVQVIKVINKNDIKLVNTININRNDIEGYLEF